MSFVEIDGRQRTHRFDYLAEFKEGSPVAIAVKPFERAKQLNFKASLTEIKRDLPVGFADKVVLVTEREWHRVEVQNAELLNFFRRCPDTEADNVISDLTNRIFGEISLTELISKSGLGARGFRAAFRAIYAGKLIADTRELITRNSIVAPRGKNHEARTNPPWRNHL